MSYAAACPNEYHQKNEVSKLLYLVKKWTDKDGLCYLLLEGTANFLFAALLSQTEVPARLLFFHLFQKADSIWTIAKKTQHPVTFSLITSFIRKMSILIHVIFCVAVVTCCCCCRKWTGLVQSGMSPFQTTDGNWPKTRQTLQKRDIPWLSEQKPFSNRDAKSIHPKLKCSITTESKPQTTIEISDTQTQQRWAEH